MKVLFAPDSFGGTLSAGEAAAALAQGWRSVRPQDDVVLCPLADGGEGTVDVLAGVEEGAAMRTLEVADASGRPTVAKWLVLQDGTHVLESAEACGLARLPQERRNPLETTSYGLGQLLAAARDRGARRIVVGLGGSATNDGGAGVAIALRSPRLRRPDGNGVRVGGRWIADLDHAEPGPPFGVEVVVAADVRNPLLGPRGATRVYAPQKGADPEAVATLESALASYADVVERDLGGSWRDLPGAGAAGGLGFGLAAFVDGQLIGGAAWIAERCGLAARIAEADVVVTGEGSIDAQTTAGKVVAHVLDVAGAANVPVLAVAGRVAEDVRRNLAGVAELGRQGLQAPTDALLAAASRLATDHA